MENADHIIRGALKKAQAALAQYLEPGGPNESQTVKQLPLVIQALLVSKPLRHSSRRQNTAGVRLGRVLIN